MSSLMSRAMDSTIKGPVVGSNLILAPNAQEYHDLAWFLEAKDKVITRPGVIVYGASGATHGSLTTVTNCQNYDSPDDSNYYANDDNESDTNEVVGKVKDPFQSLAPVMGTLYGLIDDESDLAMAKIGINKVIEKLLEKKKEKVKTCNTTTGGVGPALLSLPETDSRKKDTRKRPRGSPPR
jgi:hypothetical protein